jgi:hypothetical protein
MLSAALCIIKIKDYFLRGKLGLGIGSVSSSSNFLGVIFDPLYLDPLY